MMGKTKDKPTVAIETLRPYVKRAMDDPELRDDLVAAFVTAKSLYEQIGKRDGVKAKAKKVSDKDFQDDSRISSRSSRPRATASGQVAEEGHKVRNRVILLTGVTLGVLYNPWTGQATREWIMDQVAGGNGGSNGYKEFSETVEAEAAAIGRRRGGRHDDVTRSTRAFVPGRARARPGRGRTERRCPPPGAARRPAAAAMERSARHPMGHKSGRPRTRRPRLAARQ